jgi:hypothetical protein
MAGDTSASSVLNTSHGVKDLLASGIIIVYAVYSEKSKGRTLVLQ